MEKTLKPEIIVEKIREWLFWDYEEEQWRDPKADPGWVGLDELSAIANLLTENGYGPGKQS